MNAPLETPVIPGLWPSVWKLLRLRWNIWINSFLRSKLRNKILTVAAVLAVLGFLAILFIGVWQMLRLMRSPELAHMTSSLNEFFQRMPVLVFTGTFLGVFITSFGVLLQAMYLSGDMDFLLATPVPIRAVFVAKLVQALLPNFGLICLFALPVLFGLGASQNYTLVYYPVVVLVMSALSLAAAGLSSLGVMAIVRYIPARRVAEVLGFVGAIASFVCSQSGQLAGRARMDGGDARQALELLARAEVGWSPLTWAAHGVTAIGARNWAAGVGLTGLTLALTVGLFAISLVIAERLYYSGWASLQGSARKRRPARRQTGQNGEATSARLREQLGVKPSPLFAIIAKDWLTLRRDLRNLSQLVTPMILGVVYAIMVLGGERAPYAEPGASPLIAGIVGNIETYASVGLSLFVGWMLLGRLAGMGFGQEGRSFWVLKTAPVGALQMILAKYLVAFLPTLTLSGAYLLVITFLQGLAPGTVVYAFLVVVLTIAGNTGINLAFGIVGANLNWEDPRQMQRTSSGCLGAIAAMLYLPLALALFFGPAIAVMAFEGPEWIGQAAGLLIGGGGALFCAIVPLLTVQKRVLRLGEE